MRRILLGLLLGLLCAAPTAWSVLRRDTLVAAPNGYKLPSLVVTGTSEFDGAVTLPTGDVTGTEILDGTVTAADIATDGVDSAEIATAAVGTSELATGAVSNQDMGAVLMDKIIFCGNSFNNTTGYIGPAATAYLAGGSVDLTMGGTACDAIPESTTETTADEPIATNFPAFKVHGLYCRLSSDPTADVTVALRSAGAATTPSVTCTIAGTGSATHCRALIPTTTDIAAGATVAVQVVTTENLSAQDVWCELYFSLS